MFKEKSYIESRIERFACESQFLFWKYKRWTIGLTSRPNDKERELAFPDCWNVWEARDEADAKAIEAHFLKLGMKSKLPANKDRGNMKYVFIF